VARVREEAESVVVREFVKGIYIYIYIYILGYRVTPIHAIVAYFAVRAARRPVQITR
jgi:hypothetical protein